MSEPYIKLKPGDTIRAEDWNDIQARLRDDLISHTHAGGARGTLIAGDGISPGSDLKVRQVMATDSISAPRVTAGTLTGVTRLEAAVLVADRVEAKATATVRLDAQEAGITGPLTAGPITTSQLNAQTAGVSGPLKAGLVTAGRVETQTIAVTGPATIAGNLDVAGLLRCRGVSRQVQTARWTGPMPDGPSLTWANLPVDMLLVIDTDASTLLIDASLSRCQHVAPQSNTEYRITVDDVEIAKTNTGGSHDSWNFRPVAFHAASKVPAGRHAIRVQYKTVRPAEQWFDDANGSQDRRLTVVEIKD